MCIRDSLMDFEDAYGHHYDQNILSMEKKPERIWRTDADFYVPVSYTHLDVYKRQVQGSRVQIF